MEINKLTLKFASGSKKHLSNTLQIIRAGPIPILSIGYRPILQAFRYVPIPKNFQILLSEKYLNLIEQAASRKAPTLVFQENWLDNNLLTCYTYSGVFSGVWNLDACWLILIL
jgi:hypothetical protein